ncbi:MAG: TraB/GumN family protein [Hyphomicrobiaceae bacterium]|nr:MAG: TraB/GumN family protein [Hyphomicrobiaceae bacterium]
MKPVHQCGEWELVRRFLYRVLIGLALAASQGGIAAAQQTVPGCSGRSILDELKGTDAYARIEAAAAQSENSTTLLWKIERAGRPVSYLFGTMHLTDARITTLSPALRSALGSSRRLILEVDDLSQGNFKKAFASARDLMLFSGGQRLEQLLSAEEFRKVSAILERSGLPAQIAGLFRPWVATLMLALPDCEKQRVGQGLLPLDAQLAREARAQGIGVIGLETLDLQFRTMAGVPQADQIEMLKASLRLHDRIDDVIETTVQLYLGRRLGAIWPLQLALAERVGVPGSAFNSSEQSLLVRRNLGMRDNAAAHLAEGGVFIAVGALHLPGKQGLVNLLRDAGYTLTPVE